MKEVHLAEAISMMLVVGVAVSSSTACEDSSIDSSLVTPPGVGRCDDFDELRQPLYGDLHIHTSFSYDANLGGTRLDPSGAYRYARGEPVPAAPFDDNGDPSRMIQIDRPLDFVAVTDHASFFGTVVICQDPTAPGYDDPLCQNYRTAPTTAFAELSSFISAPPADVVYPNLCGDSAAECMTAGMDVWSESQQLAEDAYDRSSACAFTPLLAYEWNGNPRTNNLHRNIIFANATVPSQPVTYFDEPTIEGIWERLRADCIDVDDDCDVLTIPHNSNLGGGFFFALQDRDGNPFDRAYATERSTMEPLIEVFQHKGDSECAPGQTISDELCGFEKIPFNNFRGSVLGQPADPMPQDFVRAAYGEGMKVQNQVGANPFKYGLVASTDTHIPAPGGVSEFEFQGHTALDEPPPGPIEPRLWTNPAGLAGVWAEENSREAIFAALKRRETFATSGPRIVVRFFGGWDYPDDLCDQLNVEETGYQRGVSMGGDLPARSGSGPEFLLWALQDPGTADHPGTPLQRIQIIKGWLDEAGEYQVNVIDVAGDANNGASVDLTTCEADEGSGGFSSLCSLWSDPSFDPNTPAIYYARVVENPTCRWSVRQCLAGGVDCDNPSTITEGYEDCCEPEHNTSIQERAWTSPIWYTPPAP